MITVLITFRSIHSLHSVCLQQDCFRLRRVQLHLKQNSALYHDLDAKVKHKEAKVARSSVTIVSPRETYSTRGQ